MNILDLGCGRNKYPNSIGSDIDSDPCDDVICNLNAKSFPFRYSSFDMVSLKGFFI